ncbi:hypothetical protein NIES2119_10955 [[Phormidium ambiguum] IAM M-71]|uniref:Uncharacterized protein n=1 Tax=[Phormidium ambiguum] IAM M-71 TaxID=454136 RepID=A0A1U7ILJ5_9CYAN|nr:hypothetical protein [Phormidium ambiguum]OKH38072.1 hypothetical protein NIES2119_10955 [Phormidium ambiguum IAM M-71]
MLFSTCPCCSNTLLRHIRSTGIYWFCSHCYQEMPNCDRALNNLDITTNFSHYRDSLKVGVASLS